MRLKTLLVLSLCALMTACDKENDVNGPGGSGGSGTVTSANGKIQHVGKLSMADGPHDLLVVGSNLFAKRDNKLFKASLSNPKSPNLVAEHTNSNNLGKILSHNNKIYIPNTNGGKLLEFDENLNLLNTYSVDGNIFNPTTVYIDANNKVWMGGSNGSQGMIHQYSFSGSNLVKDQEWIANFTNSSVESIIEKSNHIIVSIPRGDVLAFNMSDISAGPVSETTFANEPGHEKWGYTLLPIGNTAFWANWGAGLATVDISSPTSLSVSSIISNSAFINQFPGSEGTNVYDVAYNSSKNYVCAANGWSGVFIVSPSNPTTIVDYIDPEYFQNRCIETYQNYIYTGNISGGMSGDLKGIMVFEIK